MEKKNPLMWAVPTLVVVVLAAWSVFNHTDLPGPAQPNQPSRPVPEGSATAPVPGESQASLEAQGRALPPMANLKPVAGTPSVPPAPEEPIRSLPPQPGTAPAIAQTIPATRQEARDLVDRVQFALRDYRLALGGNPVGDNAEITRALFGDNLKQVKIPLPEGSMVNGQGQLCDPWGTPYFFHALSGTHMEVRSAGPDQKMWTTDDVLQ